MSIFPGDCDEAFYPIFLNFCLEIVKQSKTSMSNDNLIVFLNTIFLAHCGFSSKIYLFIKLKNQEPKLFLHRTILKNA